MNEFQFEPQEVEAFLSAISRKYGYDFRDYTRSTILRRIRHRMKAADLHSLAELRAVVLKARSEFDALLFDLSITVTEMFRDPSFFLAFRQEVVPWLRTFPSFKIWQAGCATGQESYSFAILLEEEGLLDRALIYATDFNPYALEKAKAGVFTSEMMQEYTGAYFKAGGRGPFSRYFVSQQGKVMMSQKLKDRIVFGAHNLVTDTAFSEVQVVVCRNVLIYFNRKLQDRVLTLFENSLVRKGYLCLGKKESLVLSGHQRNFEAVRENERIFRKKT